MMFLQSEQMNGIIGNLPHIVTAIGGLGTAAFGLVEAIKPMGVNHIGFTRIANGVRQLTPGQPSPRPANGDAAPAAANALPPAKVVATLKANWYNGTDLGSQKSIAKSLIKMGLTPDNASALAAVTGVGAAVLKTVASKIANGDKLEPNESDVFARFDFSVTALLDELYQHADQVYRNWTRILAGVIAVALAVAGGWTLDDGSFMHYLQSNNLWIAVVAGLLAVPLAPIAKDVSSALATAVNTMQAIKK